MSAYQYVEFIAIDAPVSEKNLEYMRRQSTRAEITKWRFTNEYHFGDFHGNATEMLRRGYDAHLHFANYGIRKLMFRLPHGLPCEKRTFAKYAIRYLVDWDQDKRGKGGVLTLQPVDEAGEFAGYLKDVDEYLERLAPLHEMLMSGDLRPLFLVWLACCENEDARVPPIPAGLHDLTDPLEALAEFFEIPQELIAAAGKQSPPAPAGVDPEKLIAGWLRKQKKADLQRVVREFLSDEPAAMRSRVLAGDSRRAGDGGVAGGGGGAEVWGVVGGRRVKVQLDLGSVSTDNLTGGSAKGRLSSGPAGITSFFMRGPARMDSARSRFRRNQIRCRPALLAP